MERPVERLLVYAALVVAFALRAAGAEAQLTPADDVAPADNVQRARDAATPCDTTAAAWKEEIDTISAGVLL